MNTTTIGCFDSGVGGLTVLHNLVRRYPQFNYIYFGDTANAPYGDKSKEDLEACNTHILDTLLAKQVDAIVFACNTSISLFYDTLQQQLSVPTFEIITPGCKAALAQSQSKQIGILATTRTCESHIYANTLKRLDPTVQVTELAAPSLVPLIEAQRITDPGVKTQLLEPLHQILEQSIDTLIYGCSHYPYLDALWKQEAPHIHYIDPADHLRLTLPQTDPSNTSPSIEFISSGNPQQLHDFFYALSPSSNV